MTLSIENYNGIQALDGVQFIQTTLGTGVTSGLGVTVDGTATSLTYDVTGGVAWLENTELNVTDGSVTIPDGDIDWPRKDLIYVTETSGLETKQGVPRDPKPEGSVASKTMRPETPEFGAEEGVPVAEIWVPSGASDPADTIIRDRRLRPWADYVLTGSIDLLEAGSNETITGTWTFDANTTVTGDILGEGTTTIFDATAGTIGNDLVATTSILPDAVTNAKLATDSVGQNEIQTDSVGQGEVQTDAIGASEIQDNAVGRLELQDDAAGAAEVDQGEIGIGTLSPKTVELDSSATNDNAYTDPIFVPPGKTANLYAWGKQLLDGTNDIEVELRFVDPAGSPIVTETGEYSENVEAVGSYSNTGTSLETVTVEIVNTGTTVYTGGSTAADGVRFAHSVRVE